MGRIVASQGQVPARHRRAHRAFRRAVLRLFVRREIFEAEEAQGMLEWPHSGFHVHDEVLVPGDDTAFLLRLARHCARNPVALQRLEDDAKSGRVKYWSDKQDGPTAGAETLDALEFLARVTAHIPDKHQVMTRYYGWYANRTRGERRQRSADGAAEVAIADRERLPVSEARLRWAELLRRIFEVDPLRCPRWDHAMRIVAFITERAVIDRILLHVARNRPAAGPPHWP